MAEIFLYTSLSEVEDHNDRTFLTDVAQNAARNAINENMAINTPITVMENGWIVKKTAAGYTERIAAVVEKNNPKRKKALTKGTILHVRHRQ